MAVGSVAGVDSAAAPPVPGGRYVLTAPSDYTVSGDGPIGVVQVARSGRSVSSRDYLGSAPGMPGSYVEVPPTPCRANNWVGVRFRFGGPDFTHVHITRNGSFDARLSGSEPDGAARVRGVFVSPTQLDLVVVSGWIRPDPGRARCRIRPVKLHFKLPPAPRYGSCLRAPGKTIEGQRTRGGRIYSNWGADEYGRARYVYGCLAGGRAIALGRRDDMYFGEFKRDWMLLNEPYVAYDYWTFPAWDAPAEEMRVVDLRGAGRLFRSVDPVPDNPAAGAEFVGYILTDKGSLAWEAAYTEYRVDPPQPRRDIWIADRSGTRLLDRGADIAKDSLDTLGDTRVQWRLTTGRVKSARIIE